MTIKKILIGVGIFIAIIVIMMMTNKEASDAFQKGMDDAQETVNEVSE